MRALRWITLRRLSYVDCVVYCLGFSMANDGRYFTGAFVVVLGSIVSVALEQLAVRKA